MKRIIEEAKEIEEIWGGFRAARVLLTANNYRLFDHLKTAKTADEVASVLKTDPRATEVLLNALTGLGLLRKKSGRYMNTPVSNRFLVKGSPHYQGDIIRHADTLWKNWSGLDEVIKTGRPNRQVRNHDAFIRGMHNLASLKAEKIIRAIGLRGVKTALDLGGGPGTYSMEMAKKEVSVTLFDRPETVEIAREIVKKSGIRNINFIRGDFLSDDIGKGYDLIFISQVLHSLSKEEIRLVIGKSRKALNPEGRLVIQEFYISNDGTYPLESALFSVNMLVNTAAGRCYSPPELKGWLSEEGFRDIRERMVDGSIIISGKNTA